MATEAQKRALENDADLKLKIKYVLNEVLQTLIKEANPFDAGNRNASEIYFIRRAQTALSVSQGGASAIGSAVTRVLSFLLEDLSFTFNEDEVKIDPSDTQDELYDMIYGEVTSPTADQITFGRSPATDYNYVPGVVDILVGFKDTEKPEIFEADTLEAAGRYWVLVNDDGVSAWSTAAGAWVNPADTEIDRFLSYADAEAVQAVQAGNVVEIRKTYPAWWYDENAKLFRKKLKRA